MATTNVFQNILAKGIKSGKTPFAKDSVDWFRKMALETKRVKPQDIIQDAGPFKRIVQLSETSIGKMYLFGYDPKHKETLPYYDRFPLIFPIEYYNDSMLGINMHYLPPVLRAKLMDAIYQTINNTKYNNTTKLKISYQILNSAAKYKYFKPCIKKYLFSHTVTPFMYVAPSEWDVALMLPTDRFAKAQRSTVWKQSLEMI